jgi:DNA repair exonuclease SbcCD nuclease subunit
LKFAILNDTHACIRNSSDIFLDHQGKFYTDVFFPYMNENNIKHIVHLGDYFDNRRFISIKGLNHHRQVFLSKLREYGITMDLIPGNHDVYYKNTNDLNSLKELLGHYMNEINLIMDPKVMDYDGMKMALLPWINSENEDQIMHFLKTCDADIVGAHLELTGFEMHKGIPCTHGMEPDIFSRFEMVLSGHFHTKSTKGNITYLGSQMEFFWNDCDDPKYFHIFDTETRELTPVRSPLRLFEKIYYDDSGDYDYMNMDLDYLNEKFVKVIVVNKKDSFVFDTLIDRIQNRNIHELKIAENFNEFIGTNVEDESIKLDDTDTLLSTYIDAVETDLDKDKLKAQVKNLMLEAQSLEIF